MTKRGFTLIELLVVIAIIGIVLAVSVVSYLTAQKQVRDTRRKTDLMELRQALETYRSENGTYPADTSWTTDLSPDFITVIPTDPDGSSYGYVSGAAPIVTYSLCTSLEIVPMTPDLTNCSATTYNYEVRNP